MKLNRFYSECKKYAETHTPDVLEAVLKAPIVNDSDAISIKPRKKFINPYLYGTAAACIIIALISVATLTNMMKQFPIVNNPSVTDNIKPSPQTNHSRIVDNQPNTIKTSLIAGKHENTVTLSNGVLYFNQVENVGSAKIKLPEGAYKAEIDLDEYITYLDRDPRPTWIPEGLEESKQPVQIWYYKNGEILDSSWAFHYSSDLKNSKAKRIDIDIDKRKLPRTDVGFSGEEKVSNINDTEIIVGYRSISMNYNTDKEPTSFYDFYYTEFIYNGIGYRITAERGVTQEEFIKVLQSIII